MRMKNLKFSLKKKKIIRKLLIEKIIKKREMQNKKKNKTKIKLQKKWYRLVMSKNKTITKILNRKIEIDSMDKQEMCFKDWLKGLLIMSFNHNFRNNLWWLKLIAPIIWIQTYKHLSTKIEIKNDRMSIINSMKTTKLSRIIRNIFINRDSFQLKIE